MIPPAGLAEMGLWQRFWEYPIYQNALAGGAAIALLCSVLSVLVVLKRMSFIGQGISHAAFGGVAVALLAGLAVEGLRPALARDAVVAGFCIASAVAIGALTRRGGLSEDTAIGICLVAAMALGVLLLDVRGRVLDWMIAAGRLTRGQVGYTPSLESILFGNILFISRQEALLAWALAGLIVAGVAATFKELVFFAFDEETAEVFGVRTGLLYYGLLVCLGVAVVAAMRSLGVILASALLVLPGASARLLADRIGRVMAISVAVGVGGVAGGLLLSIWLRFLSPGGVIVVVLCAAFAAGYAIRALRRRLAGKEAR